MTGQAAFRLYRARASFVWLLADDDGPDHRIPVASPAVLNVLEDRYRRLDDLLS